MLAITTSFMPQAAAAVSTTPENIIINLFRKAKTVNDPMHVLTEHIRPHLQVSTLKGRH